MSDGNINKMRAELRAVRDGWRVTKADQDGWTHQYMQDCRTLTRKGPVISATIIGIVFPVVIVVAIVGWIV